MRRPHPKYLVAFHGAFLMFASWMVWFALTYLPWREFAFDVVILIFDLGYWTYCYLNVLTYAVEWVEINRGWDRLKSDLLVGFSKQRVLKQLSEAREDNIRDPSPRTRGYIDALEWLLEDDQDETEE